MKTIKWFLFLIILSCSSAVKLDSNIEKLEPSINASMRGVAELKSCKSETIKYGLISGKIVNGRNEPSINGKVEYKFIEGELVFYISKNEKQDTINGDSNYWFRVENQFGKQSWVFGKYLILVNPAVYEDCIFLNIIKNSYNIQISRWTEKGYSDGFRFYYGFKLERKDFNNKQYYVLRYRGKDNDGSTGYNTIDYGDSALYALREGKIEYVKGISNYDVRYTFYDLDNDGYTEFFIQNHIYSLIILNEKDKKNISPPWGFGGILPSKLLDSYLEVKEIVPGKECEIIKHFRFAKDQPMRVTKFKWDGQKFVEGPVE